MLLIDTDSSKGLTRKIDICVEDIPVIPISMFFSHGN